MQGQRGTIRQIMVITDGCSNVGSNPVDHAARARRKGAVVNVIGILDDGDIGQQGRDEVLSIAEAGGGLCRLVSAIDVSATAQMMTHQTMQMTLQQVVNQELLQVMGKTAQELPPQERAKVMQVVDKLEEEVTLQLVVAIDTSASMRDKMPTVREAVRDLVFSLQARLGDSLVAVIAFPGDGEEMVRLIQPFDPQLQMTRLEEVFAARGGTPTGPAIEYAAHLLDELGHGAGSEDGPRSRSVSG